MALNRTNLSFRTDIRPLRLIDLSATLTSHGGVHFADATDWSFHVISHTWSEKIRDLSIDIGKLVLIGRSTGAGEERQSGLKYNDCFANSQLAGKASYENLMDFFRLLVADGVKKVWFDALCINQTDDVEKSREICHMGAYYRLSAGCYVVTHGIGTEVGFKALNDKGEVPRWFTRAWTYQESVLPENLMFIVERFDMHICQCLKDDRAYFDTEVMWIDWDEELIHESNYTSETFFRRRIPSDGVSRKAELYVLGAQAYWRMMTAVLLVREKVLKDVPRSHLDDFLLAFGQLAANEESMIDVELVVRAIRRRECTVEEDRVLGMLGLLGFKGELQLRTKQTLDHQLLWLAKTLMAEKPDLLVNLCAADFEGNHGMPCASWLPDLRHKKFSRFEKPPSGFPIMLDVVRRHAARVVELKEDGKVVMSARAVQGYCSLIRLPLESLSERDRSKYGKDYAEPLFRLEVADDPTFYINFCYLREEQAAGFMCIAADGDPFALHGGLSIPAVPSIHKLRQYHHPYPYTICKLILLLLGQNEMGHCVVMLSVTDPDHHELHKVGILHTDARLSEHLMGLFSPDAHEFTIGSFGSNLTRFLSMECQEILQTLTTN